MRLAIVSDIHGNLEALEAVLADLEKRSCDRMICLGDFVGYGASPNECTEKLRPLIAGAVIGNHDAAAIGKLRLTYFNVDAAEAARWTDAQLTPENRDYLLGLPYRIQEDGALLVHASPTEPEGWHYVLSTGDAAEEMKSYPDPVCFIGHSHVAGAFERSETGVRYTRDSELRFQPGRRYLVNVGSVGQPRDGDPRAAYVVWDRESGTLVHHRVGYDIDSAGRRIVQAGLPQFLADRLQWGE